MISIQDIKNNIGRNLRELRESKGLTQEQLAEILQLETFQTINRIENGHTFVSADMLEKLCNFFEVSPSIFFIKKVQILTETHQNYVKDINMILPALSDEKLKYIYNFALLLQE